ncbi:hypothetical protein CJO79_20420 (plasmid) [Ralstonia solanacearum]|nr:hypothetical protein CJO76_20445 [Ralstonia solanacearum]AXV93339.1 hypothetical protein CJO79_20420 [Ralstonia solanacearum]AXW21370.1 hypothetical protein CJO85_20505 [Ralstonia solanacearum]AXW78236.1 hypothetical protein CJO97_20420 [Ralstonia solanacearum]BEU74457.1 hypothetical protein MAFF211271_40120 [Ralstonia pseudosolanacearum]
MGQAMSYPAFCTRLIDLEDGANQTLVSAQAWLEVLHRQDAGADHVPQLRQDGLSAWLHDTRRVCQSAATHLPMEPSTAESLRILARYAPIGLLAGCVLQNIALPANCHLPLAAYAHAAHARLVGGGQHSGNLAVLFRQFLEQAGLFLPPVGSALYQGHRQVPEHAWCLSAYRLSLALFPEQYQAEILGAAWFECLLGVPALVGAAQAALAPASDLAAKLEQRYASAQACLETALKVACEGEDAQSVLTRVQTGFSVSHSLFCDWLHHCAQDLEADRRHPARAMVQLVRDKGRFADGYHSKLKLDKQPFDELIVGDAERFVEALARSRWVSPGRPDDSLLVTRLLTFGGPMFRVFSEQEEAVIRDWIGGLEQSAIAVPPEADSSHVAPPPALVPSQPQVPDQRLPVREMYYRLLNLEQHPQIRQAATEFCNNWLARSARGMFKGSNALPFDAYSHRALRDWFEARAAAQVQSYAADAEPTDKSRDDVIDEALQLCPMILIDGAWLQRWTNAGLVDSPIGALLYKILSDEIGNGDTALNHPNIYRALMAQMGVDLPDFRSREFAAFARFTDAAFEVPVFWLSVSLAPHRYLPETLGLNLAMELSGVGGAYRTARDELRQHGFSTLFVDLHNTIDNVSTGHSAMALDAIELRMDQVLRSGNPQQVRGEWHRIWTGFRALAAPPRGWREWLRPARYAH